MIDRADHLRALRDEFIADGRFIEAGWIDLCLSTPPGVGPEELTAMRLMFFAGATYLFEGVMRLGNNPTRQGVEFLHLINAELKQFGQDALLEHVTAGHA